MDRIAALQQFIAERPDDPFPRYGLALEYQNQQRHDDAWTEFSLLLQRFPDYVPTYLMAGGCLVALGRTDEAEAVYRKGIAAARAAGDSHAASEIGEALSDLL